MAKYSDFTNMRVCAAAIVTECILKGSSDGWCGTLEDLEKLKKICGEFGVEYVDDFNGTWKPKKGADGQKEETE